MFPIALAFVACSADYQHVQDLELDEPLPAMDEDCTPDAEDTEREGHRVVTWIEPVDDGCRAALYARVVAADWKEVDQAIDEAVPTRTRVSWPEASVALGRLWVEANDALTPPAGTILAAEQLLSTDHRQQAAFDADPLALVAALEQGTLARSTEHLLGFTYIVTGEEQGTLEAPLSPAHPRVVDLINESYAHDEQLYLVSVASVIVPAEALAELGGAELRLQIEEKLAVTAELSLDVL